MVSQAFSPMTTMQWASMPSDTNGVESLTSAQLITTKGAKA